MKPVSRWSLMLLAALAGIAGLIYATRGPDESPAAVSAKLTMASLPLRLPASAPADDAVANAASQPAAPVRAAAPAATAPSIGSEGYGPHIESAQAGNDIETAWKAVQWLNLCASIEDQRKSYETIRGQGIAPEAMTQLMMLADAEARRCQTITAQHRALLPELAARAMRAGVPEAAATYADAVSPGDLTTAQRQEVTDSLRRDAHTANAMSLRDAAMSSSAWGLSDAERLSFLMAARLLYDQPGINALAPPPKPSDLHLASPPTPQQLAEARLAAQQILERAGVGKP